MLFEVKKKENSLRKKEKKSNTALKKMAGKINFIQKTEKEM